MIFQLNLFRLGHFAQRKKCLPILKKPAVLNCAFLTVVQASPFCDYLKKQLRSIKHFIRKHKMAAKYPIFGTHLKSL